MRRILVTGNCGFIGQNFVRMFSNDYDIVGVDSMEIGSDAGAARRVPTIMADISDAAAVDRIMRVIRPEAIVNFAANSHVDRSIDDAAPFVRSNIVGAHVLLDAAVRHRTERFLQVSTDEVYGDLQTGDPPFSNPYKLKPSSPYSASKAAADMLALSYHRTHGLDVVITRTANNYGPYQYIEKLIPVVIRKALRKESIPVYGQGKNIREWIHVRDNCRAIAKVLRKGGAGWIYNIGTGAELTNLDLVRLILDLMGAPESLIEFVPDRPGHDLRYAMDSCLIRDLGWEPKIPLMEGLKETIRWYEENPDYWGEEE
jgi:dTDP-glucose 4,6-dehydratase